MLCARHPDVETELTCGRCGTPICPRCMTITDVGARCQTCLPRRQPTPDTVTLRHLGLGLGAALLAGVALGVLWGLVLPPGRLSPIGSLSLYNLGAGFLVGYLIAQAVSRATHHGSGPRLQAAALAGVAIAYLSHNLMGEQAAVVVDDTAGYIATLLAALVAYFSLR